MSTNKVVCFCAIALSSFIFVQCNDYELFSNFWTIEGQNCAFAANNNDCSILAAPMFTQDQTCDILLPLLKCTLTYAKDECKLGAMEVIGALGPGYYDGNCAAVAAIIYEARAKDCLAKAMATEECSGAADPVEQTAESETCQTTMSTVKCVLPYAEHNCAIKPAAMIEYVFDPELLRNKNQEQSCNDLANYVDTVKESN